MKMLENDPACVTCITEAFHMHRFIENILNTLVTFVIFSLEARLQHTTSNSLDLTFDHVTVLLSSTEALHRLDQSCILNSNVYM